MKTLVLMLAFALAGAAAQAQKSPADLSRASVSPERKALLDALRTAVTPDLKRVPKLVVNRLSVKGGFAFFVGRVKDANGADIDFRKTAYKERVEAGLFDGDGTTALLKKVNGGWRVLVFAIGPTDVPWGCWWKEHKAPREIFEYTETGCE